MVLPNPIDAIHKAWLLRVLSAIADDAYLTSQLRFKGGTCAALRGIIHRFSIDLDFDLVDEKEIPKTRKHLEKIFTKFDLEIDDQSKHVPQYFLKYRNKPNQRNTLRIDITCPPPKNNDYEPVKITAIDRILLCHTGPTMFANKLVAFIDRFQKHGSIAGRDMYDIHTFFFNGYRYKTNIIEERTGQSVWDFFHDLKRFIESHITQTIIDQDLNTLLSKGEFQKIRHILTSEVIRFIEDELKKIKIAF